MSDDGIPFWHKALLVSVVLAIIIGAKVLWAVVVHDNWRCAIADCRIVTK